VRVLGIDLGTKRIGLALSDPTGAFASPFSTVESRGRASDLTRLQEIVESNDVEQVVIGMPTTLRGEQGLAAQQAEAFAQELAEQLDVPVTTWDERMTTVVAERALIAAGERRESRRDTRDKVAAAVMLQSYLDAQRLGRPDAGGEPSG
jgi:putative Holliday junction resolvase